MCTTALIKEFGSLKIKSTVDDNNLVITSITGTQQEAVGIVFETGKIMFNLSPLRCGAEPGESLQCRPWFGSESSYCAVVQQALVGGLMWRVAGDCWQTQHSHLQPGCQLALRHWSPRPPPWKCLHRQTSHDYFLLVCYHNVLANTEHWVIWQVSFTPSSWLLIFATRVFITL